jgi:hypothetical protein
MELALLHQRPEKSKSTTRYKPPNHPMTARSLTIPGHDIYQLHVQRRPCLRQIFTSLPLPTHIRHATAVVSRLVVDHIHPCAAGPHCRMLHIRWAHGCNRDRRSNDTTDHGRRHWCIILLRRNQSVDLGPASRNGCATSDRQNSARWIDLHLFTWLWVRQHSLSHQMRKLTFCQGKYYRLLPCISNSPAY